MKNLGQSKGQQHGNMKESEPVFEPLTKDNYDRRIVEAFPNVYLMTIGVIQGVALGILATNTFGYITDDTLSESWARFLPYSFLSFIMIITVSYEYTWFVAIFRWSPGVVDALVPFSLGFSEVGPTFFLTNPSIWLFLTAGFCTVGGLAFLNTLLHSSLSMFDGNEEAYRMTKNTLRWDIFIASVGAVLCVMIGTLVLREILDWRWQIPLLVLLAACPILITLKDQKFMNALRKEVKGYV